MNYRKEIKRQVRLLLRALHDVRTGARVKFAGPSPAGSRGLEYVVSLRQPIRPGASVQNKLINIRLACAHIRQVTIRPGQIFSFWHIVGKPSESNGFRRSRNIVGGRLSEDVGGGLCQVSGMLYHLALLAGLEVQERHPHSLDIYREEERPAPLGSDATVVFGYKDLRFENPYPFPLSFSFEVSDNQLICQLTSSGFIAKKQIRFQRESNADREIVTTVEVTETGEKILAVSHYGKLNHFPS